MSNVMSCAGWVRGRGLLAVFGGVGLLSSPVAAQVTLPPTRYEVYAQTRGGNGLGSYYDNCSSPLVAVTGGAGPSVSCESGVAGFSYHATASAAAAPGVVRVSTTADGYTVGTTPADSSSQATITLTDYFAIRGPANAQGLLTGSIMVDGSLSAAVTGSPLATTTARSGYSVQAALGSFNGGSSGNWTLATTGYELFNNRTGAVLPVETTVTFGSDGWSSPILFNIYAILESEGRASAYQASSSDPLIGGAFSTSASFGNTIYWGGISSIVVEGVPITDYDQVSSSGADYRFATAVPEPAAGLSGAVMLGACGVFVWLRRRTPTA